MPAPAPVRATDNHHPDHPDYFDRPDRAEDATVRVARLYPYDTAGAQQVLSDTAAAVLRDAGHRATVGQYGLHATAEIAIGTGRLVLVPMADLLDLDAELAVEDDQDPAVWHLLARARSGRLLEPGLGATGCPSVLWATAAGIDPGVAVSLVAAAFADPEIRTVLGLDG